MSFRGVFWTLAIIFMLAISIGDIVLIRKYQHGVVTTTTTTDASGDTPTSSTSPSGNGGTLSSGLLARLMMDTGSADTTTTTTTSTTTTTYTGFAKYGNLGTKTVLGKTLMVVSIIFQSAFLVLVGIEIFVRAYMSAFGFPCSFQRREICFVEYRMTTFWKAIKIESAIAFPIVTILAVLDVFLDIGYTNWKSMNLPLLAVMVGVPLIEVILCSISHYLAKQEYFEQYPEEMVPSDEESALGSPMTMQPTMTSPESAPIPMEEIGNGKQPVRTGMASA